MTDFEKRRRDFIEEIKKPLNVWNDEEERKQYTEFDKLMDELFESVIDIED